MKKKAPSVNQTMTNSPGGIQAGRDVIVQTGSKLIHSLVLRISVEVETPEKSTTSEQTDVGLQSAVALFTVDNKRIRFVTDFMVHDQQVTPKVRRLSFNYTPETPNEIQGQTISFLESINVLAVNYAEIFKLQSFAQAGETVMLRCVVELNGLQIGTVTTTDSTGNLATKQGNLDVSSLFREIPKVYTKAVGTEVNHD